MRFPLTQAELGNAAARLGGSFLSGVKVLGGIALGAARAGVEAAERKYNEGKYSEGRYPADARVESRRYSTDTGSGAVPPGKFFSRSAPAASGTETRTGAGAGAGAEGEVEAALTLDAAADAGQNQAYWVTVLDLEGLKADAEGPKAKTQTPAKVAEFQVGKDHPVSVLAFAADGTALAVATRGGHTMKVFRLCPVPAGVRQLMGVKEGEDAGVVPPWHVYDLRRGRTSAVVDSLTWAHDARWVAVATEKGTVHVFATNPYGGPADEKSHLGGRVVNVSEVVSVVLLVYGYCLLTAVVGSAAIRDGTHADRQAQDAESTWSGRGECPTRIHVLAAVIGPAGVACASVSLPL